MITKMMYYNEENEVHDGDNGTDDDEYQVHAHKVARPVEHES